MQEEPNRSVRNTLRFSTNPKNYWHVLLSAVIPKGSKIRTVRFGGDILARMDYWISRGQKNWQVRSLLFPKAKYTSRKAAAWATQHEYPWIRVEG